MGLIYATLTLRNPRRSELASMELTALADTGALHLVLPAHIAMQMQIQEKEQREVVLADGSVHKVPYAGPVEVSFKNRTAFVGALIMGDQPLLGAIPMEDLDLVLSPATRSVEVNPFSPNIPLSIVK